MNEIIITVFQNLFGVSRELCTDALSMQDVEGWDSVNHITLVLSLEEASGIQFTPDEMSQLTSIGNIKNLMAKHEVGRDT